MGQQIDRLKFGVTLSNRGVVMGIRTAKDLLQMADRVERYYVYLTRHDPQVFVEQCDFVSCVGHHRGGSDLGDGFLWIGLVHLPIDVIEKSDLVQTQWDGGAAQLGLADASQSLEAGVLVFRPVPAALAARGTNQICLNAFGGVFRQRGT